MTKREVDPEVKRIGDGILPQVRFILDETSRDDEKMCAAVPALPSGDREIAMRRDPCKHASPLKIRRELDEETSRRRAVCATELATFWFGAPRHERAELDGRVFRDIPIQRRRKESRPVSGIIQQ